MTKDLVFSLLDVYVCPYTGVGYVLGITGEHETIAVRVKGYYPHFFAHNKASDKTKQDVERWVKQVSTDVANYLVCDKGEFLGCDVVQQKLLFGFSSQTPYTAKFYCTSTNAVKQCARQLRNTAGLQTYEHDKDARLAFLRENSLTMYGQVTVVSPHQHSTLQQRYSNCDHEYHCTIDQVSCQPYTTLPQLVVAAYDIETEGLDASTQAVFQVSVCFRQFPFQKDDHVEKMVISSLPTTTPPDHSDFAVVTVTSEKELIKEFVNVVTKKKASILCGWNNLGFDAPFLWKRANHHHCVSSLQKLSYLKRTTCKLEMKEKSLNSSAFGTNVFHAFQGLHGLSEVDGLLMARKSSSLKLNSYRLNNVAKELLNSSKDDVTYDYITRAISEKCPEMLYKVAKYCVQDSLLVLQIFEHLKDVDNMVVMASLTNVPLNYIAERGQTVKCQSLVHTESFRQGYIWNQLERDPSSTKYQGSTVIDSVTGLYTSPVAVMDFNSLYPSIMMAYGLSPETLVGTVQCSWSGQSDDLVYYDEQSRLCVYVGSDTYAVFDKVEDPVIPHVLKHLIHERKRVRKDMSTLGPDDTLLYSQLHAKQLALKIMANSIYGTCGFANGPLPLVEIAAATTAIGRMSIHKVKSTLASLGYDRVIAGDTDSVMLLIEGETVQGAIEKSKELCVHLNKLFPPPMKIDFEKVYHPYLVLTKKRYAGLLWEDTNKPPKRDTKGIATKRRDFAPIVSKTVGRVIDLILWSRDLKAAVTHVQTVLQKISTGETPLEDFVIRKELKKTPENYTTPTPHSTVAAKMIQRNPDTAPKLGERVPFVVTTGQGDVSSRAEDPSLEGVYSHIDYLYYVENQLKNPVTEIFRATKESTVCTDVTRAFSQCASAVRLQQAHQRSITDFFHPAK